MYNGVQKIDMFYAKFFSFVQGQLFAGSLSPTGQTLSGWLDLATSSPRHPSLVAGKQSEVSTTLKINNIFLKKLIFMILPALLKFPTF